MPFELKKYSDDLLSNPYVMAVLKVSLILYASKLAPEIPAKVSALLSTTPAKLLGVFLIAYLAEKDFQLAILLAVAYIVGSNLMFKLPGLGKNSSEGFAPFTTDLSKLRTFLGEPTPLNSQTIISPRANVYPGCENVKYQDLVDAFKGNTEEMQKHVMYTYSKLAGLSEDKTDPQQLEFIARAIGLPYNVELNDENAPLVATMLMNYGFEISDTCQPPK